MANRTEIDASDVLGSMPRFDKRRCLKLYESAIEADSWGQLEEALEAYAKLVSELTDTIRCVSPSSSSSQS